MKPARESHLSPAGLCVDSEPACAEGGLLWRAGRGGIYGIHHGIHLCLRDGARRCAGVPWGDRGIAGEGKRLRRKGLLFTRMRYLAGRGIQCFQNPVPFNGSEGSSPSFGIYPPCLSLGSGRAADTG